MGKSFEEETEEQILKTMKVNVMSAMYLQKLVFMEMKANYGHIVNISSLGGLITGKTCSSAKLLSFLTLWILGRYDSLNCIRAQGP